MGRAFDTLGALAEGVLIQELLNSESWVRVLPSAMHLHARTAMFVTTTMLPRRPNPLFRQPGEPAPRRRPTLISTGQGNMSSILVFDLFALDLSVVAADKASPSPDPLTDIGALFEAMLVFAATNRAGTATRMVLAFDLRTSGIFGDHNTGVIVVEGCRDVDCSEGLVDGRTRTALILEVSTCAVRLNDRGDVRLEIAGCAGGRLNCRGDAVTFLLGNVHGIGEYAEAATDQTAFERSIQHLDSSMTISAVSRRSQA